MPLGSFRLNSLARYISAIVAGRTPLTVTAFGNAKIENVVTTGQTYAQIGNGSIAFDGADDYLQIPNNSAFNFGTSDFTIEVLTRPIGGGGYRTIMSNGWNFSNTDKSFWFNITSGGNPEFRYWNGSSDVYIQGASISDYVWRHIAVVGNATHITIYQNGVQVNQVARGNIASTTRDITIGSLDNLSNEMLGYIDELRVSNIARYSSAYTPSTTQFYNDADTLLLIHADGANGSTTFSDDTFTPARTPLTVTAFGNARVSTAQSKFGGASALFDGTDDYLLISGSTQTIQLSSDFTIEGWIRFTTIISNQKFIDFRNRNGVGSPTLADTLLLDYAGGFRCYVDGANRAASTPTASTGVWYHIAAVRSGNDFKLFINGTNYVSYTQPSLKIYTLDYDWVIGINGEDLTAQPLNGNIDEIRISKTARYTGNFTPSTTQFYNDADTLVLIHADGTNASTTFSDDVAAAPPARSSDAVRSVDLGGTDISASGGKFGGSAYKAGEGADYITVNPTDTSWGFNSNKPWTIEHWYKTSVSSYSSISATLGGLDYGSSTAEVSHRLVSGVNGQLIYIGSSSVTISHSTSWRHYAYVNDGNGTCKFYLDGVLKLTKTSFSQTLSNNKRWYFGSTNGTAGQPTYYYDEMRFSNIERYTGAFTPPSAAFENDDNTVGLFHFDGNYNDDTGV